MCTISVFSTTNSISRRQNKYFLCIFLLKRPHRLFPPPIYPSHGYLKQAHRRKEGCMTQFPYGPVEWPRSIQLVRRSWPDVPAIRKRAPHWGCDARVVSVRNPLNSLSMTLLSSCRKAAQPVSRDTEPFTCTPSLPSLPSPQIHRNGKTPSDHTGCPGLLPLATQTQQCQR